MSTQSPSPVVTRAASLAELPADSHSLVQTIHLALTAGERHASRVAAAERAARAALPECADSLVAALCLVEAGGTGGPGGYAGDATRRMSWATGLGKGRRQATDGGAWTAAIVAAGNRLCSDTGHISGSTCDDVAVLSVHLTGPDLEWPLAYCLRLAAEWGPSSAERATPWAKVAVEIAARCEPDDAAGRLARRYGLTTMTQLYRAEVFLRRETVARMLLCEESDLARGSDGPMPVEFLASGAVRTEQEDQTAVTVELLSESEYWISGVDDRGWKIRISTRDYTALTPILARAWVWCEGSVERDAFIAFHDAISPSWQTPETRAADRAQWTADGSTGA